MNERKVNDSLISKTDNKGTITYCNKAFVDISGFSESELLGKPHSIVRHPDMPRSVFAYFWDRIISKREVNVFVKNLAKDGGYYWVFANVTPSLNMRGHVVGYYSVRRRPSPEGVAMAIELYAKMKEAEEKGGIKSGLAFFNDFFNNLGKTYENFVLYKQIRGEGE